MEQKQKLPKGFLLFFSVEELLEPLSDKEQAALFRGLFKVARGEALPKSTPSSVAVILKMLSPSLRANVEKYARVCEERRRAANARWGGERNAPAPAPAQAEQKDKEFLKFLGFFPKNRQRDDAIEEWEKLDENERAAAIESAESYCERTAPKYIMNATKFLAEREFEPRLEEILDYERKARARKAQEREDRQRARWMLITGCVHNSRWNEKTEKIETFPCSESELMKFAQTHDVEYPPRHELLDLALAAKFEAESRRS